MSKYNVGAYIRLSRDESYSDSNSINNQIKMADYYCENNDLYNKNIELLNLKKLDDEIIEELDRDLITKYVDKIIVYEEEKVDVILKYEVEVIKL